MPQIDLREYKDIQFFSYVLERNLTANQFDPAGVIKIQNDSDFLVQKIMAVSTGLFNLQINDSGTGRNFFNNLTRSDVICGTAQRPNILLQPRLLFANSQLNFTLQDLTAGNNRVQIVLEGIKLYKTIPSDFTPRSVIDLSRYIEVDYFAYQLQPVQALAALGSTQLSVSMQADSDFLIQKIVGRRSGTYQLQLTDTSTGRSFSDNLVDDVNLVGNAQQPAVLLHPQLILANATVGAAITDTSGAPNTIELVLEGIKLFRGR